MFGIGQPELIVIVFVMLLFFGPKSLPKVSKTLADSLRSVREGFTGGKNDKSLSDITHEVTSSAREIKESIIGMPTPSANEAQPQPNTGPAPQPEATKE